MNARFLCIIVLGLLQGILFAATESKWLLLSALGIMVLLAGSIKLEKRAIFTWGKLICYFISILCGMYRYETFVEQKANYEPVIYDDMKISLQGELKEKECKNKKYLYYLTNCYLKQEEVLDDVSFTGDRIIACNQVIAEMETDSIPIGKILVLEGRIAAFHSARNEGNFDEVSFYQSQNIDFKLKKTQIKAVYGKENVFCESLYQLKQQLKAVYQNSMSEDTSGVMIRMVLGDKSLMNPEINQLYQKVGISHILAISGLHISVIGMSIYKLFRRIFGSYLLSGVFAGGILFAYGCMTGFRPSSARAIFMFFMMLAAGMLGRTYDSLSALSLSAICLLWENPMLLWYAGFVFSYGAVLAVVLVANTVTKAFEEKKKIRDALYSGFAIQLITIPLTAYFYFEVAVYGMFVNLLVLPMMSVLLGFALIGGLIGLVSPFWAEWLLMPCEIILEGYQMLSVFVQKLPMASWITGQPKLWRMVLFYCAVVSVVVVIHKRKQVRGFLLLGILLLGFVLYPSKKEAEWNVLDVGQGDGIYLRTNSGYDILIDGGSTDVSNVGMYRILPFLKYKGVQTIEYWFVSHADKDHISGLQEILESGYPIKNLVFSKYLVKEDSWKNLVDLAERAGTQVLYLNYLDCLHLGEAQIKALFPYPEFVTEDKNAASLVLYYEEEGFSGLFTGDIGEEEERFLAENSGEWLKDIDVYKAAHHGSRYSNSMEWLQLLNPKITVISSGAYNRYGHPHKEAVERIKATGSKMLNTAECGQITVKREKEEVSYNCYIFRKQKPK